MKGKFVLVAVISFGLGVVAENHQLIQYLWQETSGKEMKSGKPDYDSRDTMILKGKESYRRGKYLKSKWYFRQAIMKDPAAVHIWEYYDQATIFAFAERIEKDRTLLFMKREDFRDSECGKPGKASAPAVKLEKIEVQNRATTRPASRQENEGC